MDSANVAQPTHVTYSIYVGDLHPDVTDDQLIRAFNDFPSVDSVRVCKDSITDTSLGYAYVNFNDAHDATRALETMNHMQLNGKAVRLMWSRHDTDYQKNGIGNVFVKNLSESIDHGKLQNKFQEFGNILSCKVVKSEDGSTKGYGFIQYETEESAKAAIENLNGTLFEGKKIYVAPHVRKADRDSSSAGDQYTNLYLKNLDVNITEQVLEENFSNFGKISSIVISTDEHGSSKGFGFVNFVDPDDARRAAEAMNGFQLGSKILYVGRAQKKAERQQILRKQFGDKRMEQEQIQKYKGSNVYVKNIDDTVTEDTLRELFSQCGSITSVKLMQNEKAISRGFGFVSFSTPEEASKAVKTFQSYMFHGKPLYVSIAQRKEERQAHLQIHYAQQLTGIVGSPLTAVTSDGYRPRFFPASLGVIAPCPPQSALMYQPPVGVKPGWSRNSFIPVARPTFQASRTPSRIMEPVYTPTVQLQDVINGIGVLSPIPSSVGRFIQGSRVEKGNLLAAANPAQQKIILGEQLYPLVEQFKPDLASKITGMLIEMDNTTCKD